MLKKQESTSTANRTYLNVAKQIGKIQTSIECMVYISNQMTLTLVIEITLH